MSKDIFDDPNDLGFDDVGRINDEGLVDVTPIEDRPVLFEDQFEMRSRELQASPRGMQTVDIFPTKKGPWTGNNQLGIQQKFAPDANNQQTIYKMDEWGMPELWTLCLGLDFDRNTWGGDNANFDMTALINFGIGGVIQQVEIDWVNGAAITLPLNAINVIAQYNLELAEGEGIFEPDPPIDLVLRASLARGTLFQCAPTRTYNYTLNTDSIFNSVPLNIPPFAKSVKIIPIRNVFASYNEPTGRLIFFTSVVANYSAGFAIEEHPFSQLVEYLDIPNSVVGAPVAIDIPTGARSLVLIATLFIGPETNLNYRVVFQIGV